MATAAPTKTITTSYIDTIASNLLLKQTPASEAPNQIPTDGSWIRNSFIVTAANLDKTDADNRTFSSAALKYSDSSIGGNHAINPPPQFTRYADIRHKGLRAMGVETTLGYIGGNLGMGRYYSEAIDDNKQMIHMRFGVPNYNSMTQFLTGFYSSSAATMARTGRGDDNYINKVLQLGGNLIGLAIAPLFIVPLALMALGTVGRFFLRWPASKYYYLKPAMPAYWSAVTNMVNQIAVNNGLINYINPKDADNLIGKEHNFTPSEKSIFSSMMPEFSPHGLIDVKAIATKAKRMEMRFEAAKRKAFENGGNKDFYGIVRDVIRTAQGESNQLVEKETRGLSLESYWSKWFHSPNGSKSAADASFIEKSPRINSAETQVASAAAASPTGYAPSSPEGSFDEFAIAELADGASWISFKVDYTGTTTESFSNSFAQSGLAQKINSISSSAREMRLNLADGNILGGIQEAVTSGITSVLTGVADVLHLDGLMAAAGNAFVDIPQHWENSTASLSSTSYTMTLITPYGNPISQMISIYIPLCSLIAGVAPLSTGKQSYTSPFLCELYDRGRCISRLAMISQLSITRGVSNLGFSNDGRVMAIDVNFTVTDLSSIVAMPITPGFNLTGGLFDTENAFSDYLMALSGMELLDIVNRLPMLKYQANRALANIASATSVSNIAQWTANLPGINLLSMVMRGTDRK